MDNSVEENYMQAKRWMDTQMEVRTDVETDVRIKGP